MKSQEAFYPVGRLEQLLPQIGRVVSFKGREIALFRTSADQIFALENRSPHPKGGPLAEGMVSGNYVYDPLYDWKIDLTSGRVQAPDTGQVLTFPVQVIDGQVLLGEPELQGTGS
ncbi:nitrite reductase small subunit NirD [Paenibacillus sp. y28]|uniref:nitrite reductase small subunit NirD n=1 Tax=Paenibacillus sp. y28 TaxID=3129110 RepID=UPI00301886BE